MSSLEGWVFSLISYTATRGIYGDSSFAFSLSIEIMSLVSSIKSLIVCASSVKQGYPNGTSLLNQFLKARFENTFFAFVILRKNLLKFLYKCICIHFINSLTGVINFFSRSAFILVKYLEFSFHSETNDQVILKDPFLTNSFRYSNKIQTK